jgi:DNA-binding NtrC family response regulator
MSIRLLVVEDSEVFRQPLQRALEAAGFEVIAVSSGEDALALLDRSLVDVVLTDSGLQGMDGVTLITRIRARHPALAIIMMSAGGTIESAVGAMRSGANDYLAKPFEMPELLRALHRSLDPLSLTPNPEGRRQ